MLSATCKRLLRPLQTMKGFTLVELVMVLLLIGILSVFALPKVLNTASFQARTYADKLQMATMYANRLAIAQRNPVQITFSTTGATMMYVNTVTNIPIPVLDPKTGSAYSLTCPSGFTNCISLTGSVVFNANNSGRAVTSLGVPLVVNIVMSSYSTLFTIENETGYIRKS